MYIFIPIETLGSTATGSTGGSKDTGVGIVRGIVRGTPRLGLVGETTVAAVFGFGLDGDWTPSLLDRRGRRRSSAQLTAGCNLEAGDRRLS